MNFEKRMNEIDYALSLVLGELNPEQVKIADHAFESLNRTIGKRIGAEFDSSFLPPHELAPIGFSVSRLTLYKWMLEFTPEEFEGLSVLVRHSDSISELLELDPEHTPSRVWVKWVDATIYAVKEFCQLN